MVKKLLRYLTEGNTFFVLEIFEVQDQPLFCLQKIQLKKGELEVVAVNTATTLEDILPVVEKKKPLLITLNTAQVLKKSQQAADTDHPEVMVTNAFPNLQLDNFYYQLFTHQGHAVISIAKKAYVDDCLEQFKNLGLPAFRLSLGLGEMTSMVGLALGAITGSNFELHWQNDPHKVITPLSQLQTGHLALNGLSLQYTQVLGFAQLLSHLGAGKSISNLSQVNTRLQNELSNTRVFDFGLKATLGCFVCLLLANFLVFQYYHNKNQELEASLASGQLQDKSVQQLSKRVALKEERLKVLRHSKDSKTSWYLDQLGKSVPNSVSLGSVEFQPLLVPLRSNKPVALHQGSLQISGVTHNKIAFTDWSDTLESQSWVERIEVVGYNYRSNASANFTLNLILSATEYEK